jgi:hypothetical protein
MSRHPGVHVDSSSSGEQEPIEQSPAPPEPPRPLTALASRRAWIDPRVRAWWVLAITLILIAGYLLITRYLHWREDSRLVTSGLRVEAKITQVEGITMEGKGGPGDSPVYLQYEYGGQTHRVYSPALEGRRFDQGLTVGGTVAIRIDPRDPERWTPRTVPVPLAGELTGGLIVLPIGIVLLLVSVRMRSGIVRTWRQGRAAPAVVLSARHTATIPRGFAVQCTLADQSDKRILNVFAPADADVREGSLFWILFPSGSGRPAAARWFG